MTHCSCMIIVAAYYLSDDALIGLSPLTVTEMRSSAMLLCYAALLEEAVSGGAGELPRPASDSIRQNHVATHSSSPCRYHYAP